MRILNCSVGDVLSVTVSDVSIAGSQFNGTHRMRVNEVRWPTSGASVLPETCSETLKRAATHAISSSTTGVSR